MKTKERLEARRIRSEEQLSLKEIASRLGVSKGSVSRWVADLPLPPKVIKQHNLSGCTKAGRVISQKARETRIEHQRIGAEMAEKHQSDPLFVAGCMMHWSEGSKSKNTARICNVDPDFLLLWLQFMKKFFGVKSENFCLSVHCHLDNGKTQQQIKSYWLRYLNIPRQCLRSITIVTLPSTSTGAKMRRHPYGCANLSVHSTTIVQQIWGGIKYLANIRDDARWVD